MSPRRPRISSRHWAKPIGLSLSAHLAAFVAIPALLGMGIFALSQGPARQEPRVHELRFEMARSESDSQDLSSVVAPLESLELPASNAEEWPIPVEPMEWIPQADLLNSLDEGPAADSLQQEEQEPAEVTDSNELPLEPTEIETVLEPEGSPEPEVPIAELDSATEPSPDPVEPPTSPETSAQPESWTPLTLNEYCPEPRYPSKARKRHQEGVVILLLTVAADGKVLDVQVTESSGYSILDRAAKKALATWRFRSAPVTWTGTSTQVLRRIVFRLPG